MLFKKKKKLQYHTEKMPKEPVHHVAIDWKQLEYSENTQPCGEHKANYSFAFY